MQTEFPFELPRGFIDANGQVHRAGMMRLATARDELAPLRDPRVRNNEAYLVILLLSQVITRLGTLTRVTPEMLEGFFAADIAYLQDMYRRINDVEIPTVQCICPNCAYEFEVEIPIPGEF
ncbi:MAG: phage tail assembly protein [Anaerolineae bacterium]